MAITFLEKRKKQRYLILVLAAAVLVILFVLWYGFFARKAPRPPVEALKPREVKINWEVLKDPRLKELQPFEEIKPFEEEIGRENPFLPY